MKWASRAISVGITWAMALAACGGELRAKPQFECEPGVDRLGVVCSDGLIGSCVRGFQRVAVCGDTTVCEASWQEMGAYKCSPNDALGDSGTTIYAKDELAPALEAADLVVLDDDGLISPGEQVGLAVWIRNAGPVAAESVNGVLSTAQPGARITNGAALYFADVDSGATACGSSAQSHAGDCQQTDVLPQLTVDESVAVGTSVQIDLTVMDAQSHSFTLGFGLTVRSP